MNNALFIGHQYFTFGDFQSGWQKQLFCHTNDGEQVSIHNLKRDRWGQQQQQQVQWGLKIVLGKKWGKELPERKSSFYQSRRVPWHQASHTLSEQGLQTSLAVHLHVEEDRVYTTKESKRIMTLPEDYILTGTLNEKLARIGLMVAPICMKYVAESVYQTILEPWNEVHNRTN